MTEGAEFCDVNREVDAEYRTHKHGWMGFKVNIDPFNEPGALGVIAQVMNQDSGCAQLILLVHARFLIHLSMSVTTVQGARCI